MADKNFILPPQLATNRNPAVQIATTGIQALKGKLVSIGEVPTDEPIGTSVLGTPIFDDVTFPADQYTNLSGDVISFDEVVLQSVIVVANQAKNVIKTPISGRNGTVKEYISAGDFVVSVSGQIVSDSNTYPELEVENFRSVMEANAALSIVSTFINDSLAVGNVVIENYNIRQIRGSRNSVEISFNAVSDVSRDLEELIIS